MMKKVGELKNVFWMDTCIGFIAGTKESIVDFKLLARKLRCFAINSYFCQPKMRKL